MRRFYEYLKELWCKTTKIVIRYMIAFFFPSRLTTFGLNDSESISTHEQLDKWLDLLSNRVDMAWVKEDHIASFTHTNRVSRHRTAEKRLRLPLPVCCCKNRPTSCGVWDACCAVVPFICGSTVSEVTHSDEYLTMRMYNLSRNPESRSDGQWKYQHPVMTFSEHR